MTTIDQVCSFLEQFAPPRLAEEWDNVGLLVGDRSGEVTRLMTCLTVTPASAAEAVEQRAELIVAHHPLPFRPLKRLTGDSVPGRLLLQLIAAGVSVCSPHTAFDSAARGINQRLGEALDLLELQPLEPLENDPDQLGPGRWGRLPAPRPLREVAEGLKSFLRIERLQHVGPLLQSVTRIAVACGSAGEFLGAARRRGCDLLVTGETNFHTCLEAEAEGVALLLPGHYASERFAVEALAEELAGEFGQLHVWASRRESDPLAWV